MTGKQFRRSLTLDQSYYTVIFWMSYGSSSQLPLIVILLHSPQSLCCSIPSRRFEHYTSNTVEALMLYFLKSVGCLSWTCYTVSQRKRWTTGFLVKNGPWNCP